jgi:tetratricopeptide (TPR) repeat protein
MKARMFLFAVLFGGVLFTTAAAQDADNSREKKTVQPSEKAETPADAQTEEIEILRRLLDRALAKQQHALVSTSVPGNAAPEPKLSYWQPNYNYNAPEPKLSYWQPNYNYNAPVTLWDIHSGATLVPSNTSPYILGSPNQQYATWATTLNTVNPFYYHPNADHLATELRSPQGVYLKGYGIVYTATLTLPTVPSSADLKKPAAKALTEWERTRLELRGEKIEPAKAPPPQEAIADAVLRVLARNGRHISQLAETEQVTVALTLSSVRSSCMQCHGVPNSGSSGKAVTGTTTSTGSSGDGNTTSGSSSGGGNPTELKEKEILDKIAALKKDAQKAALLGDLHLKQGKNEQAVASFEEALKAYQASVSGLYRFGLEKRGTPEKDPALEQELVVAGTKLIQAYTAMGKTEEVKKTLKVLEEHLQKTSAETPSKPAEAPVKEELPAKLIISAPKKLLDLVGADKITFEEFRKNATVEYQPPRNIEKQPAKTTGKP